MNVLRGAALLAARRTGPPVYLTHRTPQHQAAEVAAWLLSADEGVEYVVGLDEGVQRRWAS